MVEEWTTCMRLLSWRRHQGTMLKHCILILPVSDPAKQAAQVVKHHVFVEVVFEPLGHVTLTVGMSKSTDQIHRPSMPTCFIIYVNIYR